MLGMSLNRNNQFGFFNILKFHFHFGEFKMSEISQKHLRKVKKTTKYWEKTRESTKGSKGKKEGGA